MRRERDICQTTSKSKTGGGAIGALKNERGVHNHTRGDSRESRTSGGRKSGDARRDTVEQRTGGGDG